jgi:hypothetical protein
MAHMSASMVSTFISQSFCNHSNTAWSLAYIAQNGPLAPLGGVDSKGPFETIDAEVVSNVVVGCGNVSVKFGVADGEAMDRGDAEIGKACGKAERTEGEFDELDGAGRVEGANCKAEGEFADRVSTCNHVPQQTK